MFPCVNHFQGQLPTLQYLSVVFLPLVNQTSVIIFVSQDYQPYRNLMSNSALIWQPPALPQNICLTFLHTLCLYWLTALTLLLTGVI